MTNRIPGRIAGSAAAIALAAAVSGCATTPWHEGWAFDDLDAAAGTEEAARIPELVPADATNLRMFADMREFGIQVAFESEGGITADYCAPSDVTGASALPSGWWPDDVPAEGWTCGWWEAFESGGTIYAWDTREPAAEEG